MTYNKTYIQELIIDKIAGAISEEDNHILQQAILTDPGVAKLWNEMQEELATDKAQSFFDNINENAAWDKIEPQIEQIKSIQPKQKGFISWISIAALLCITLSAIYFWQAKPVTNPVAVKQRKKPAIELRMANGQQINLSDTAKNVINTPFANLKKGANGLSYTTGDDKTQNWNTLTIPAELDYQITLSDGTLVWLNSASSLRFPFSFTGTNREVYLTGEAFFKVAKNAAHPFIVHTAQTNVQVLGTEFNVNSYPSNITTTSLVEGSVATSGQHNEKLLLKPGYQAIYTPITGFLRQPFDAATELAWMHGQYYFHNQKLRDISEVLQRWFNLPVVFDDAARADNSLSGAIEKNKPVQVFIQNLKSSAGVDAVIKDGVLHIK
ncbi:FecR family protein [Mucilaginibacter ginsenosidivorax]|uniref:FecR family protein n=1 Tax=Mucilaginibacter ginsenosidivorax TaxID=862126 RepID=UPI0013153A66|nr:FecR domain-containing protein [Mucilaginibacter ginsenosidivorax]